MATAKELMNQANQKLAAKKDSVKSIGAIYKFVLTGDGGGTWIVNLKDAVGISEGEGTADCSLTMSATDYADMLEGRANPQQLFFQGRLQIEGDIGLAMKLTNITDILA